MLKFEKALFLSALVLFWIQIPGLAWCDERPNIVFLMADDQCTYSMGCYGTPNVKTPNLDRLAEDGMVFDRHYVSTAICMASRATVMTGMYEFKHGCNFMHGPLLEKHWSKSYPVLLKKAGYTIGFAGKFGFEVIKRPGDRSLIPSDLFDDWGGGPGQTHYQTARNPSMKKYADRYPHSTLAYGAFAADFIHKHAKDTKPFCLSISFKAPHRPVSPDPRFDGIYQGITFEKPPNFGREYGKHFAPQSRQGRQFERFQSWGYATDYQAVMAKYYQQIYAIDVAVGMIRKAIQESGANNNTVIIYTSDNGFLCGSHGYGSKVLPYEESSRVPLIVYDPRFKKPGAARCSQLTCNTDFAPTILRLAGIPVPDSIDGKNLMPLYEAPDKPIHDAIALLNVWGPKKTFSLSVVTRFQKYIYWPYEDQEISATEEFYDLKNDPWELRNRLDLLSKNGRLRMFYDSFLEQWRREGAQHHGYATLPDFFARQPAANKKN